MAKTSGCSGTDRSALTMTLPDRSIAATRRRGKHPGSPKHGTGEDSLAARDNSVGINAGYSRAGVDLHAQLFEMPQRLRRQLLGVCGKHA